MTMKTIGPWTVHRTRIDHENPWIRLETSDVTHPDGSAGIYGVVRMANLATGVLPIDEDGHTWLVGQHRFAFDTYSWELPEGGGTKGIDPQISAARELKEETGLSAAHFTPLGRWQLSNSVTDEVAFGYLAWDLTSGTAAPEPSEALTVERVPFADLVARIRAGEITDSFTHLMVFAAIDKARQGQLPPAISRHLIGA
ncbi:MAG: NUDIX hydrolase [Pseudomonadota bacterium]